MPVSDVQVNFVIFCIKLVTFVQMRPCALAGVTGKPKYCNHDDHDDDEDGSDVDGNDGDNGADDNVNDSDNMTTMFGLNSTFTSALLICTGFTIFM